MSPARDVYGPFTEGWDTTVLYGGQNGLVKRVGEGWKLPSFRDFAVNRVQKNKLHDDTKDHRVLLTNLGVFLPNGNVRLINSKEKRVISPHNYEEIFTFLCEDIKLAEAYEEKIGYKINNFRTHSHHKYEPHHPPYEIPFQMVAGTKHSHSVNFGFPNGYNPETHLIVAFKERKHPEASFLRPIEKKPQNYSLYAGDREGSHVVSASFDWSQA